MSVIEVAIGAAGQADGFRVTVVKSPAGEAAQTVPLDVRRLLGQRKTLQRAVLASGVATRRMLTDDEQCVQNAGRELFAALLGTGDVASRYQASVALAAASDGQLQVKLRTEDPGLAALPWEAMYDPAIGGYVCLNGELVRHVPVSSPVTPLTVNPPLRVLGVVSSPRGLEPLDTEREQEQLGQAVAGAAGAGLIEITWAPVATWAALQEMLLDGPWHVVHFVGHGDFDPSRDEGVIALTGADGRAQLVPASRLVYLLGRARPQPRLVVLNSCSGAATGSADLFSGTAAALVRGGISSVVAMQYAISDTAAVEFSRGFYAALARGRGVDEAVSQGRLAIMGLSGSSLEWVTPVLYLRGDESRLFAIPPGDSAPAVPDPPAPQREPEQQAEFPRPRPSLPRSAPAFTATVQEKTLRGHRRWGKWHGGVHSAAFSPDGTLLASGSGDRTVRLWEMPGGKHLHTLTGHTEYVYSVAFSPDGTLLATGSADKTIRLWEIPSGKHLHTLTGHTKSVRSTAFSPDGTLLASSSNDRTVRIWEVLTRDRLHTLTGHTNWVYSVAFSPDGTLLATGSADRTVRLWEIPGGKHLRTLTGHTSVVLSVAFSPDSTLLATSSSKTTRLWEMPTGKHLRTLTGHTNWVRSTAFSPDGTLLATGSHDKTIRIWETSTGRHLRPFSGHTDYVNSVAFSPDGTMLASAGRDDTVRLWF